MVEPSLIPQKTALSVIFLIYLNSSAYPTAQEKLDDVTETMDSLFSSTFDMDAPLRLRKIKEKSPTLWNNEHTRALKRAAQKIVRKTKENKTRGILYGLAGKYLILQKSITNC